MPVHKITVAPLKEVDGEDETTPRSTDQNEGKKTSGCTGRRSSNRSKTSNKKTELTTSRTSISPPPQERCSSDRTALLDEDASKSQKHSKQTRSSVMSVTNTSVTSSSQTQKKLVKRRRRRKRSSSKDLDCVETIGRQEKTDQSLSSDRSEKKGTRERSLKIRRELPPRLRCVGAALSESSSDNEGWCERRNWSKEKARRAHWRNGKNEVFRSGGDENKTEVMELQSLGSVDETEDNAVDEDHRGLEEQQSSQESLNKDEQTEKNKVSQEGDEKVCRSPCSSQTEEAEEPITKTYQEDRMEEGDLAAPTPQTHCGVNGAAPQFCSYDSELEVCRICHCEGDDDCPLITPCHCTGSLSFVHQACLNQWIKSSDTRCCELCKFDFIMETKLKPFCKWEKLHMTRNERRKIFCSVLFHLIAIACMLWSLYILVKRTTEEIRLGRNEELWRLSLLKYYSQEVVLEWPFWTKLIMVSLGLIGGVVFMYIQCKVYLQLWRRLKAFNRIITVRNCPDKNLHHSQTRSETFPRREEKGTTEMPVGPTPVPAPQTLVDSDSSVEAAVAPAQNPV